jgi:hypothetical protein
LYIVARIASCERRAVTKRPGIMVSDTLTSQEVHRESLKDIAESADNTVGSLP